MKTTLERFREEKARVLRFLTRPSREQLDSAAIISSKKARAEAMVLTPPQFDTLEDIFAKTGEYLHLLTQTSDAANYRRLNLAASRLATNESLRYLKIGSQEVRRNIYEITDDITETRRRLAPFRPDLPPQETSRLYSALAKQLGEKKATDFLRAYAWKLGKIVKHFKKRQIRPTYSAMMKLELGSIDEKT